MLKYFSRLLAQFFQAMAPISLMTLLEEFERFETLWLGAPGI